MRRVPGAVRLAAAPAERGVFDTVAGARPRIWRTGLAAHRSEAAGAARVVEVEWRRAGAALRNGGRRDGGAADGGVRGRPLLPATSGRPADSGRCANFRAGIAGGCGRLPGPLPDGAD